MFIQFICFQIMCYSLQEQHFCSLVNSYGAVALDKNCCIWRAEITIWTTFDIIDEAPRHSTVLSTEISYIDIQSRSLMNNYIHIGPWHPLVISHPCPKFSTGLVKLALKEGHGWVTTSHIKQLWLLIHALFMLERAVASEILKTVYPEKYAHGFVVLCFVVVMQSFIMNSHEVFIHIHQGCFAGTGAIVRLPQCQWSKPDGYGKISQCITTTKYSKTKTVCIFLGIYCMSRDMMTSSNGNIFRVTGPLWGESTDHRWFPSQRPVTRCFDVFFDLRLNKRLTKQTRREWFEKPSRSLWPHCDGNQDKIRTLFQKGFLISLLYCFCLLQMEVMSK